MKDHPENTNHEGLARRSIEGLVDVIQLMVGIMARCDARQITMPPDFISHFSAVRHHLMRKCVGPDYSERQFCEFFRIVVQTACEKHGATADRIDTLQATNQLRQ